MMVTFDVPASDLARYREKIKGVDLSEEKKDEHIRIVFFMMSYCASIEFPESNQVMDRSSSSKIESSHDILSDNPTMKPDFSAATLAMTESKKAKGVRHGEPITEDGSHLLPG